jgi:hypothetical protein
LEKKNEQDSCRPTIKMYSARARILHSPVPTNVPQLPRPRLYILVSISPLLIDFIYNFFLHSKITN